MRRPVHRALLTGCCLLLALAAAAQGFTSAHGAHGAVPPPALEDTGLYRDFSTREVDPANLYFAPQYPLWTDGAAKRRWISLPEGGVIDASDPDAWIFPPGTRLWKEFSFEGRPVETRFMRLEPNGEWLYATYEWAADGREATLVSPRGRREAYPLGNGRFHALPSISDCGVCHKSRSTEVLGFSALQLSRDRDPNALHAERSQGVDLGFLIEQGLIVGLPDGMWDMSPRIAAATATERAALGYLHGNCGHCHNSSGKLTDLTLVLGQSVGAPNRATIETTLGQPIQEPPPGLSPQAQLRIDPGHPDQSGLLQRMGSRQPALQMPPLGTQLTDEEAIDLLRQWIAELPAGEIDITQAATGEAK